MPSKIFIQIMYVYIVRYINPLKKIVLNNLINRSFYVNKFVTSKMLLCHDLSFQFRILFVLCLWYFKQTVILIIYGFLLCSEARSINLQRLSGRGFQYFGIKEVIWKFTLFLSTLQTRQDKFTSFSANDWVFSCYVIWIMDYVIRAIFCGFHGCRSRNRLWKKWYVYVW